MDFEDIDRLLEAKSDKDRAVQEKRYLKSPFKFYGVSHWELEKIAKSLRKSHDKISRSDLWEAIDVLWNSGWHEKRIIALKTLKLYPQYLDTSTLGRLEGLLRSSTNWDQVDEISAHLVGEVIRKDFSGSIAYLDRWSADQNFWLRRASMLSMLMLFRHKKAADIPKARDLFFSYASRMLDESGPDESYITEHMQKKMGLFFIRKAIGWILRDMSKKDPESVVFFVRKNRERMSGLTFREATRKLPEELKDVLSSTR